MSPHDPFVCLCRHIEQTWAKEGKGAGGKGNMVLLYCMPFPVSKQNIARNKATIHSVTEITDTPASIPSMPPKSDIRFSS